MTAKEFLMQVNDKENQIIEQEEYIQRLRDTLDVAGIRYDKDKIQTTPDPDRMSNVLSKIIEQESVLENMKDDLVDTRLNVMNMIRQLKDEKDRRILNIVYLDMKNLKQCAVIIGFSYDYTRELHGKALLSFGEKFPHLSP